MHEELEGLRTVLDAARRNAIPVTISVKVGDAEYVLVSKGLVLGTSPILTVVDPDGVMRLCPLRLVSAVTSKGATRRRHRLWPRPSYKAPHGAGKGAP